VRGLSPTAFFLSLSAPRDAKTTGLIEGVFGNRRREGSARTSAESLEE
jgi:hypothetical protein